MTGFSEDSLAQAQELLSRVDDTLDFTRCQRPDGTFYGTGGTCRKGKGAGAKDKPAAKTRKPGSADGAARKLQEKGKTLKSSSLPPDKRKEIEGQIRVLWQKAATHSSQASSAPYNMPEVRKAHEKKAAVYEAQVKELATKSGLLDNHKDHSGRAPKTIDIGSKKWPFVVKQSEPKGKGESPSVDGSTHVIPGWKHGEDSSIFHKGELYSGSPRDGGLMYKTGLRSTTLNSESGGRLIVDERGHAQED